MSIFGAIGSAVGTFTGQPWIGAVGTALDGIMGRSDQANVNQQNLEEAQRNRDFQSAQARKQMDFQERMRGTQYQTAVSDLQKAGLNPMLAYTQGGAGTPSGASGGGSQASQLQSTVSAGMSSARQSADTLVALQSLALNQAQIDQVKAVTDKVKSETMDQALNTAYLKQQLEKLGWDADVSETTAANNRAKWRGLVAESGSKMEQFDSDLRTNTFTADSLRRKALSSLTQLEIPKSKADAAFYEDLGKANPYLKQILMMIQALRGGRAAFTP